MCNGAPLTVEILPRARIELADFRQSTTGNTELNDLRKMVCLRKIKFLLKEFQLIKSLKI